VGLKKIFHDWVTDRFKGVGFLSVVSHFLKSRLYITRFNDFVNPKSAGNFTKKILQKFCGSFLSKNAGVL